MGYANTISLEIPYEEAIGLVRDALREQGFGVLTEIDLAATMKAKLGKDIEPCLILGACNPPLAHRALEVDPDIGLLLPCNVVVRRQGGATLVQALDPQMLVTMSDREGLRPVADEAASRLQAALASLSGRGGLPPD